MQKKSFQATTPAWRKIALAFLGLLLSLVLLEAGLRLGGFVLSSIQEYWNLQSIKQKGAYRILCIGESTTQGQYPHLLEQVLNQRNIGVRFSVIDKGRAGKRSSTLLEEIESNLAEYHPDMVVAMMGINDAMIGIHDGGSHMPPAMLTTSGRMPFIRSLKIYFLARLLWLHLQAKAKEMGFYQPDADKQSPGKAQTFAPKTRLKVTSPGSVSAEGSAEKVLVTPVVQMRINQPAEDLAKRAIKLDPNNDKAYLELGQIYASKNEFLQAEDSFKKAIAINPKSNMAYFELGTLYLSQGKAIQAKAAFAKYVLPEDFAKRAIELDPNDDKAYCVLGQSYMSKDEFLRAEGSFKNAIAINPKSNAAYFELGTLYRFQGKFPQAEAALRKSIALSPQNDWRALVAMATLLEEMGKSELAKEYAAKAQQFLEYRSMTADNYHNLKKILDKKGIRLVCVQYPIRNIGPLKKIFGKNESIIFVDNESVFKEALKKGGYKYKEYFRDMFAGDFGHFAQKSNELLAQNIADVILREVFHQ